MRNFIAQNREKLAQEHYVRKAAPSSNYFFSIYEKELQSYQSKYGNNFNIIFFGDEDVETDYYSIPFSYLQDVLIPKNLYQSQKRWAGDIKNQVMNFRVSKVKRNVSEFYSLPYSTNKTTNKTQFTIGLKETNDYAIENAKREINVRMKQSVFRNRVLKNFNSVCCISGIEEKDLLVASHIIPWSKKIETRLDPSNGLCLSVLYDKLFDKGYFTIGYEGNVIITSKINELSLPTKELLLKIRGKNVSGISRIEIDQSCLEFHRQNIFETFNQ